MTQPANPTTPDRTLAAIKRSKLSAKNKLLYGRFIKAMCALEDAVEHRQYVRFKPDLTPGDDYNKADAGVVAARAVLVREVLALAQSEPATAA